MSCYGIVCHVIFNSIANCCSMHFIAFGPGMIDDCPERGTVGKILLNTCNCSRLLDDAEVSSAIR